MARSSGRFGRPVSSPDCLEPPVRIENPESSRLITRHDVWLVARFALCFPVAWVLPERWWVAVARAIVAAMAPFRRAARKETAISMRAVFGARTPPMPFARLPGRLVEMKLIETMQHLRSYRPGGWSPRTEVVGAAHVDAALQNGKGAVLWVTDLIFSSLVSKIALHRAGYRLTHLSRPEHPLSASRFGRRFLNPIVTRLERRYVEQRVLIDEGRLTAGMRTLRRSLQANGIVSITVGNESRQTVQVPVLDGYIHLAKGAPKLAVATGAPLLPVFTQRRDDGGFVTTIGAPIDVSRDGSPDQAFELAIRRYVERLEPLLIETPHLWYDWTELIRPRPTL